MHLRTNETEDNRRPAPLPERNENLTGLRWLDGKGQDVSLPDLRCKLGKREIVALDVETFWEKGYDIGSCGGVRPYVEHDKFDITCIGLFTEEWSYSGNPAFAPMEKLHGRVIVAHNAAFDQACIEEAIRRGILPAVEVGMWICTADACVALGYPRDLKGAAYWILGQDLSKQARADSKGKGRVALLLDDNFVEYCQNDATSCYWIANTLFGQWTEQEERYSYLTRKFSRYGLKLDRMAAEDAVDDLHDEEDRLQDKVPWDGPPTSLKLYGEWLAERESFMPSTTSIKDERFLMWEMTWPDEGRVARTMSKIRQVKKLRKTVKELIRRQGEDGTLNTPLKYFGAHTGRWSGTGGINFQALAKKELFGVNVGKLLRPTQGTFIHADFSNIEARVLLWLAGDDETLGLIADGMDIYEAHARSSGLYNGKEPLAQVDPDLRQLCKARVLGLGYGCGAKTFRAVALTMGGIKLTEDEAKAAVDSYRESNPLITGLWAKLEDYSKDNRDIPLPSGRTLTYHVHEGKVSYARGMDPVKIWGGLLVENVTQAVARDLLAHALGKLDEMEFRVPIHVHDSVVVDCPKPHARAVKMGLVDLLTAGPWWARGLPLDVDVTQMDSLGG